MKDEVNGVLGDGRVREEGRLRSEVREMKGEGVVR